MMNHFSTSRKIKGCRLENVKQATLLFLSLFICRYGLQITVKLRQRVCSLLELKNKNSLPLNSSEGN